MAPVSRLMTRGASRSFVAGIAAVAVYVGFTLVSYLLYAGPFTPADNWLSDLGNANLNPSGALFYNAGVSVSGAALFAFFVGFRDWSRNGPRAMRRRLVVVQILGCLAAAAMIATAVISENVDADLHGLASMVNIEFLGSAAVLSGLFLFNHPLFWRPIALVGLMLEIAALVFGFVLHTFPMEWLAVALVLAYVGLMAFNTGAVEGAATGQNGVTIDRPAS
jgi:hypothetical protein